MLEDVVKRRKMCLKTLYALTPVRIVALSLIGVAQYLIGLCRPLETLLGTLIPGVSVGMVLQGHLPIGLLYVFLRGVSIYTKDAVIIFVIRPGHKSFSLKD